MFFSNLCMTTILSASMIFSGGAGKPTTTPILTEDLDSNTTIACSVEIQPRLDVQEWQYMYSYSNGKVYKRLWSQTRGIWLTDWILVG